MAPVDAALRGGYKQGSLAARFTSMSKVEASWAQLALPEPQPMDLGCPPGSLWRTFPDAPFLGLPV